MKKNIETVACPECGQQFTSKAKAGMARALGYHRRMVHGIVGITSTLEGKRQVARLRHYKLAGLSEKQIAEREKHYAERQKELAIQSAAEDTTGTAPVKRRKSNTVEPLAVDVCPRCGMRFLGQHGDKRDLVSLKLPFCPECGIRFYFAQ